MKKLLLLALLLPTLAFGRKFYFSSSTGNDSYTTTQAQNPATPWASLRKVTQLTTGTNGQSIFKPGDTLCFKRGDVFANGSSTDTYCSAYWWNIPGDAYFTAPSGTPSQPIVITNYGDINQPLPNWLHPRAFYPVSSWAPHLDSANAANGITTRITREGRAIIEFAGVHDIVIDGIQSSDFRVPETSKDKPGFSGGWILGEWTKGTSAIPHNSYTDTSRRKYMVTRFVVKNCKFNNTMYGIQGLASIDSKITNNTFTNFKSSADTAGTHDILAGAIEGIACINTEFSYNYIKGAWGKSGRIGSCNGLGGVAFDIFNMYNSKVCYNTIIDCSGAYEIGNLDRYDSLSGSQYDTFAFNKIINCGQFGYIHGSQGDPFQGNNHHLAHWNNVVISNNKDRIEGWGYGKDVYNDGQGWAPGTTTPWWFCRNPYTTFNPPNYPLRPTVTGTAGSNIITVSSAAGISVGSVFFTDDDSLASLVYKTVTVTAISENTITLSDPITRTVSGYTGGSFYLPVSDQTWSNPYNSPFNNYAGHRFVLQYAGDATLWGSNIDTMIDNRNNAFYWTIGTQGVYDRNRYKRSSNLYYPIGGARYATILGGTLNYRGTGEQLITTGRFFADTTSAFPENWDVHLQTPVTGVAISGFTKDFAGNNLSNPPTIGLYQNAAPATCTFTYGAWTACTTGTQTRTYTSSPVGCTGTPPTDSITRSCTIPCTSFTYGTWSTCSNGVQTRSYTKSPSNCGTVPPADSTSRPCGTTPCTFTYGQWGTCVNSVQTRTYSVSPAGCTTTPPIDSVQRTCANVCSFIYSAWSTCSNGQQTRTYTSQPIGCTGVPVIDSVQRACGSVVVSSFYYRASRVSIYIKATAAGLLTIKNTSGVTVFTASYPANGKWISVSSLAAGPYVASTYGKTVTFTR